MHPNEKRKALHTLNKQQVPELSPKNSYNSLYFTFMKGLVDFISMASGIRKSRWSLDREIASNSFQNLFKFPANSKKLSPEEIGISTEGREKTQRFINS